MKFVSDLVNWIKTKLSTCSVCKYVRRQQSFVQSNKELVRAVWWPRLGSRASVVLWRSVCCSHRSVIGKHLSHVFGEKNNRLYFFCFVFGTLLLQQLKLIIPRLWTTYEQHCQSVHLKLSPWLTYSTKSESLFRGNNNLQNNYFPPPLVPVW